MSGNKKSKPKSPPARNSAPKTGVLSPPGKSTGSPVTTENSENSSPPEPLFPGGIETLLETASRKPLPQIPQQKGRKCLLYDIVQFSPKLYAKMIGQLRLGVSPEVAAEACAIGERTFYEWAQRGKQDIDNFDPESGQHCPIDSYFSRFYLDVRRAIATQAADCEMKLAEIDPRKWLTIGPGRIFGQKWAKDRTASHFPNGSSAPALLPNSLPSEDIIDATFTVTHSPGVQNGRTVSSDGPDTANPDSSPDGRGLGSAPLASQVLAIPPTKELEALEVLQEIGMITINESMRKAYQQQLSIDSPPTTDPE